MNIRDVDKKVEEVMAELSVEELEEKIAPVDCNKKPTHPDCQVHTLYGIPPRP